MVEKKSNVGMDYSVGHLRMKYLDLANIAFAQGNFIGCKGYIDDFLDTVDGNKEAGKVIGEEFDRVFRHKKILEDELERTVKDMGYLERKDFEDTGKHELEVNVIHDMKEICWRISLKNGLFFE